jgi:zinc transporter ZupT
MDQKSPRRRLTTDQKRALLVLAVLVGVIAVVVIGVAWLAMTIGLPFWFSVILAIVLAAALGLFMLLNLM